MPLQQTRRASSCPPAGTELESGQVPLTQLAEKAVKAVEVPIREKKRPQESVKDEELLNRVSKSAMAEMRYLAQTWCVSVSKWLRVVHSGYGSQAWTMALKSSPHDFVAASSHPEGIYVHIPEGTNVEDLIEALSAMNLVVRRKTQFPDMKRANKSRLQFKATLTVLPEGKQGSDDGSTAPSDGDVSEQVGKVFLERGLRCPQWTRPEARTTPQYFGQQVAAAQAYPAAQVPQLKHAPRPVAPQGSNAVHTNYWASTYDEWEPRAAQCASSQYVVPQGQMMPTLAQMLPTAHNQMQMPQGFFPQQFMQSPMNPSQSPDFPMVFAAQTGSDAAIAPIYMCIGTMPLSQQAVSAQ